MAGQLFPIGDRDSYSESAYRPDNGSRNRRPANEDRHKKQPKQRSNQKVDYLVGDLEQVSFHSDDQKAHQDRNDSNKPGNTLCQPDLARFRLFRSPETFDEVLETDPACRLLRATGELLARGK